MLWKRRKEAEENERKVRQVYEFIDKLPQLNQITMTINEATTAKIGIRHWKDEPGNIICSTKYGFVFPVICGDYNHNDDVLGKINFELFSGIECYVYCSVSIKNEFFVVLWDNFTKNRSCVFDLRVDFKHDEDDWMTINDIRIQKNYKIT